ncbi:MAG: MotA/TolQ/ExbB proton channel family protein [Proteobacteria bacterium]|nr:MotA/TolQ/ExbB proton channel family protein [Pseudomonadota bacterium]
MFAIIQGAGWPIWPLLIAAIIALAIIGERAWSLRRTLVAPPDLLPKVVAEFRQNGAPPEMVERVASHSPLGEVLAAGLRNVRSPRDVMKEAIEETGRGVALQLERYLTTLGTIAGMAPLLGLFGTVIGMIEIFGAQSTAGSPAQLAQGISIALYNTAFGLIVAIPSMIAYRHYRAKVDNYVVDLELQAVKLVEVMHGERRA